MLPVADDAAIFDAIVRAKQRPRRNVLRAIRAQILGGYQQYAAAAPELGGLPAAVLTEDQREALLHVYTSETAPFAKLRADLTAPTLITRCPFCGISESSTLDHYLPKDAHPAFAIYSRNLIPCCPQCNLPKGDKIMAEATDLRLFLRPYYDELPDERFVDVHVTLMHEALALRFQTLRPAGMAPQVFARLEPHFRLLRLGDRYRRRSLEHLRDERAALGRLHMVGGAARVADGLDEKASDWEADFGQNDWRAVLHRALAQSADFCNKGFKVLDRIQ